MSIVIIHPGMQTLVQDRGRYGYQKDGISPSGAMDVYAYEAANILVGNNQDEAALEMTLLGAEIEFLEDAVVAITGGDFKPELSGNPIAMWKSHLISKGQILRLKSAQMGCRAYVSFAGGIEVPVVMGSRSTYLKGSIGGYCGRALKKYDQLKIGASVKPLEQLANKTAGFDTIPRYESKISLRVIMGPQDDLFSEEGKKIFLESVYCVGNQCDRMGYRLDGPVIKHSKGADIISDGISLGAVQVPGHGQPIVMMSDRQTVGGYTKIAGVITADLYKMAQAKPGDTVTFTEVSMQRAHELLKKEKEHLDQMFRNVKEQIVVAEKHFKVSIEGHTYQVGVEEIRPIK